MALENCIRFNSGSKKWNLTNMETAVKTFRKPLPNARDTTKFISLCKNSFSDNTTIDYELVDNVRAMLSSMIDSWRKHYNCLYTYYTSASRAESYQLKRNEAAKNCSEVEGIIHILEYWYDALSRRRDCVFI